MEDGLMRMEALERALTMAGKKLPKASAGLGRWKARKALVEGAEPQTGPDGERMGREPDTELRGQKAERGKTGIAGHMSDILARAQAARKEMARPRRGG